MRQFRRPAPTPSTLNALRALAATLVVSAVVSAPMPMTAAQTAPVEPARQRPPPPAPPQPAAAEATTAPNPTVLYQPDRRNAEETRDRLRQVIEQYSPSLFEVFRHDPTLLRNDQYLASYPGLAAFLKQHTEVRHNPTYFL